MQEDTYYIEFRAINLNRSIKKLSNRLNYSRTLLLKLFIQDTSTQHPITIAESLQWIQTEAIQGIIKCDGANLKAAFSVSGEEERQWTVKIFGVERTDLELKMEALDQSQSETPERRQMKSIGQCKLNPLIYVEVFDDSGKTKFQENIQVSSSFSMDYQVYIHNTQEGLQNILEEEEHSQIKIVDTAFKKTQGAPKIRYVQLNENREKSVRMEQFNKHQQHQISSLKKSGAKFVPIRQESLINMVQARKYREVRREGRQKQGSDSSGGGVGRSWRQAGAVVVQRRQGEFTEQMSVPRRKKGVVLNSLYLIVLTLAVVLTGYMMFPSKKI